MAATHRLRTLSAVVFWRTVTFAVPTSPDVENLTPSLVAEMTTGGAQAQQHVLHQCQHGLMEHAALLH